MMQAAKRRPLHHTVTGCASPIIGHPGLAGRPAKASQDSRQGAFGDAAAEHQFAVNPRCAPQRVGGDHSFDPSAKLCGSYRAVLRFRRSDFASLTISARTFSRGRRHSDHRLRRVIQNTRSRVLRTGLLPFSLKTRRLAVAAPDSRWRRAPAPLFRVAPQRMRLHRS